MQHLLQKFLQLKNLHCGVSTWLSTQVTEHLSFCNKSVACEHSLIQPFRVKKRRLPCSEGLSPVHGAVTAFISANA